MASQESVSSDISEFKKTEKLISPEQDKKEVQRSFLYDRCPDAKEEEVESELCSYPYTHAPDSTGTAVAIASSYRRPAPQERF